MNYLRLSKPTSLLQFFVSPGIKNDFGEIVFAVLEDIFYGLPLIIWVYFDSLVRSRVEFLVKNHYFGTHHSEILFFIRLDWTNSLEIS